VYIDTCMIIYAKSKSDFNKNIVTYLIHKVN